MLFFWNFYSSWKNIHHSFHKNTKPQKTVFYTDNNKKTIRIEQWTPIITPNQHIRMISEGYCDTEDWSNDTKNSALNRRNKLYENKKVILNCNNTLQYYSIFDQINADLVCM